METYTILGGSIADHPSAFMGPTNLAAGLYVRCCRTRGGIPTKHSKRQSMQCGLNFSGTRQHSWSNCAQIMLCNSSGFGFSATCIGSPLLNR